MNQLRIINQYVKTKWTRPFASKETLLKWQEQKVMQHLTKIVPLCSYYKERSLNISDWKNWPIISKKEWMSHFDQINTVKISMENSLQVALKSEEDRNFKAKINGVTVGLSSGTSGLRGVFLISDSESERWVGTMLAKMLPKPIWFKQKIAFFFRANNNLYESVSSRKIQFRFFDLLEPLEDHFYNLNLYQPDVIVAPPSVLQLIAKEIKERRIFIRPLKIISVAEVLDPQVREQLHHVFQQLIHQVYQCTEGFLACTCKHGVLHINEDLVYVQKEWIDQSEGKFIPIVTDFTRTSQPLIRYRLNDILTLKNDGCTCGSPFTAIEMIEGRCDDLFFLEHHSKNQLVTIFPDFIRRWIMTTNECIEEYRVTQKSLFQWTVELRFSQNADDLLIKNKLESALETLCKKWEAKKPYLYFHPYSPHTFSKKLRRVIRDFQSEDTI